MTSIDGFVIDCTITETHKLDSEVTEYPVESGSQITDNVRPMPIVVSLDSIVSDNPLPGPVATARGDDGSGAELDHAPSADAVAKLEAIRLAREPITIETSLKRYENMVMTSLEIPRDAETGHALRFTAEFQEVIFVTNNRATIKVAPPKQTGLGAKVNLGLGSVMVIQSNAIVWHHPDDSSPLHRGGEATVWTDEALGYSPTENEEGRPGFLHADNRVLTSAELGQMITDNQRWAREKARPPVNQDAGIISKFGSGDPHSTEPVFKQGDGQWVDSQGHPVTYDPTYGHWLENDPSGTLRQ